LFPRGVPLRHSTMLRNKSAGTGAGIGAALGGTAGLLAGLGLLAIPRSDRWLLPVG
jgi:hypothetical protein